MAPGMPGDRVTESGPAQKLKFWVPVILSSFINSASTLSSCGLFYAIIIMTMKLTTNFLVLSLIICALFPCSGSYSYEPSPEVESVHNYPRSGDGGNEISNKDYFFGIFLSSGIVFMFFNIFLFTMCFSIVCRGCRCCKFLKCKAKPENIQWVTLPDGQVRAVIPKYLQYPFWVICFTIFITAMIIWTSLTQVVKGNDDAGNYFDEFDQTFQNLVTESDAATVDVTVARTQNDESVQNNACTAGATMEAAITLTQVSIDGIRSLASAMDISGASDYLDQFGGQWAVCIVFVWLFYEASVAAYFISDYFHSKKLMKFTFFANWCAVFFIVFFSCVVLILLYILADFCYDPSGVILDNISGGATTVIGEYYGPNACQPGGNSENIQGYVNDLQVAVDGVIELAQNTIDGCTAGEDTSYYEAIIAAFTDIKSTVLVALEETADCTVVSGIFTGMIDDTFCHSWFGGVYYVWVSSTLCGAFFIALMFYVSVMWQYYGAQKNAPTSRELGSTPSMSNGSAINPVHAKTGFGIELTSKLQCPKGHLLQNSDRENYQCDECQGKSAFGHLGGNKQRLRCNQCDFDLCFKCAGITPGSK